MTNSTATIPVHVGTGTGTQTIDLERRFIHAAAKQIAGPFAYIAYGTGTPFENAALTVEWHSTYCDVLPAADLMARHVYLLAGDMAVAYASWLADVGPDVMRRDSEWRSFPDRVQSCVDDCNSLSWHSRCDASGAEMDGLAYWQVFANTLAMIREVWPKLTFRCYAEQLGHESYLRELEAAS
jgi:hypothetical protein